MAGAGPGPDWAQLDQTVAGITWNGILQEKTKQGVGGWEYGICRGIKEKASRISRD